MLYRKNVFFFQIKLVRFFFLGFGCLQDSKGIIDWKMCLKVSGFDPKSSFGIGAKAIMTQNQIQTPYEASFSATLFAFRRGCLLRK